MRRNSRRERRRARRHSYESTIEDVNPMNYISNLSDVMLILAVGIMLALILHWKVEIQPPQDSSVPESKSAVSFSEDDLQGTDEMPADAEEMGNIYYDPSTGKYYYQIDGN